MKNGFKESVLYVRILSYTGEMGARSSTAGFCPMSDKMSRAFPVWVTRCQVSVLRVKGCQDSALLGDKMPAFCSESERMQKGFCPVGNRMPGFWPMNGKKPRVCPVWITRCQAFVLREKGCLDSVLQVTWFSECVPQVTGCQDSILQVKKGSTECVLQVTGCQDSVLQVKRVQGSVLQGDRVPGFCPAGEKGARSQ